MSKQQGYILLHRSLLESAIWNDSTVKFDRRSAWIDLLLKVNHADKTIAFNGMPLVVKRGQMITSQHRLAASWGVNPKTVNRWLQFFRSLGMINVEILHHRATVITIQNYSVYQDISTKRKSKDATVMGQDMPQLWDKLWDTNNKCITINDKRMKRKEAAPIFSPEGDELQ